jgi:hypothetical protein
MGWIETEVFEKQKLWEKRLEVGVNWQFQSRLLRTGSSFKTSTKGFFFYFLFIAQLARVSVKPKPIWLSVENKVKCDVCGYAAIE